MPHFYSFCRTGKLQAANFIATVPIDTEALPPVLDLEFLGNCKKRPPVIEAIREIKQCLELLERHYHKRPILYTTYEFYSYYLSEELQDYPLWIRDIQKEPKLENRGWIFWQFSNTGYRSGIQGRVDLNVFVGNRQDFEQY